MDADHPAAGVKIACRNTLKAFQRAIDGVVSPVMV